MAQLDAYERPRGLSWWPRILALATPALAGGCLVAVSVWQTDQGPTPFNGPFEPLAVAGLGFGVVGAALARPGEINPRRIVWIWTSLLAYMGTIVGLLLGAAAASLGLPPEQRLHLLSDYMPSGAWGAVSGMGLIVLGVCVPVFVLSGLVTLVTVVLTRHDGSEMVDLDAALTSDQPGPAHGREVGAAVAATLAAVVGMGLALAAALTNSHATGRVVLVWVGCLLATALVGIGTAAHVRGGRRAPAGRLLLWIGALALTVGGVLDSLKATDLSGLVGTDTYGGARGGVGIGLATFLLPAALLALVAAVSALPLHRPRLHRPRLPRARTPQHQT